jgi:hypothetical protein
MASTLAVAAVTALNLAVSATARIRDDIDIVVQPGSNVRVRDILLAHVHERARFGEITLYDVPRTRAASALTLPSAHTASR